MNTDDAFIEFECPHCLGLIRLPRNEVEPQVKCPDCETVVDAPPEYRGDDVPLDLFDDLDVDSLAMPEDEQGELDAAAEPTPPTPAGDSADEFAEAGDESVNDREPSEERLAPVEPVPTIGESDDSAESATTDELEQLDDDDLVPLPEDAAEDDDDSSDEPLKIEGLTEDSPLDEVHGIRCHICDTRIHVTDSQIGQLVECPVCYTKVPVTSPPTDRPKPSNPWTAPSRAPDETVSSGNSGSTGEHDVDDEELRLAEPVDRPEMTKGYGFEPVEDDLLKPLAPDPDEHGADDSVETDEASDGRDDGTEIHLAPPVNVPRPSVVTSGIGEEDTTQPQRPRVDLDRANVGGATRSGLVELDDEEEVEEPIDFEVPDPLTLKTIWQWLLLAGRKADFLIRVGISIALFAVAYSFSEGFWDLWESPDVADFNKYLGLAVQGGVGAIAWLFGACGLAIIFGVVLRDSAERRRFSEWPGLALSEWLGPFMFVAFSIWVASLPGLIVGNIFAAMTDSIAWIIFLTPISIFVLMPVCMVSAMFNESVWNVVSLDILRSFQGQWPRWQRFYLNIFSLLALYLIGTGVLFLPTFFFSIVGAAIQVAAVVALAAGTGLHARAVIDRLVEEA